MDLTFGLSKRKQEIKVPYMDPGSTNLLVHNLSERFQSVSRNREIIFFCIGTDRSTGDSLGPLVGTQLQKKHRYANRVFGSLDRPVHAVNLNDAISEVSAQFDHPYIVAIDACLGQLSSVGCIQIANGPIKPGAGVHKELTPVGDMHITGIVNVSGFMEYFVLQNTRLSQVMSMAEKISDAIIKALYHSNRMPSLTFSRLAERDEQSL